MLVLKTIPSPYMKRWWTQDLTQLRKATWQLCRKAYKKREDHAHESHKKYWEAQNIYSNSIKKAKWEQWDNFLGKIDEKTVWKTHRYASGDPTEGGSARVPTLKIKREDSTTWIANNNNSKAKMSFNTFFPATGTHNSDIQPNFEYPLNAFELVPITTAQIKQA